MAKGKQSALLKESRPYFNENVRDIELKYFAKVGLFHR
jgi:hypothetical protein